MKYKICFTDQAFFDINNIYSYIAFDLSSPETAEKLYHKIIAEIETLADFPFRCALLSEESFRRLGLRRLLIQHYSVIFIVQESSSQIIILRILHQTQNTPSQLEDFLSL